MKAVILAGGEGTRLRPVTDTVPKPFIRIAGKPTVEYAIEGLVAAGFKDVILTTFYKPERLLQHLSGGSRLGARIFYSVEDDALGTAGSVKKCESILGEGTFVVASGDVLADVDFAALLRFHRERGAEATIALTRVENPTEFGIVGLDARGRIERFKEKPAPEEVFSNLVNAGIYILEASVLRLIPDGEKFDFSKGLFPKMLAEGLGLYGCPIDGLWMDVGRPADLLAATQAMADRRHGGRYQEGGKVAPTARVDGSAWYPGTVIADHAEVTGSLLYEDVHIGEGAHVRGTILCAGARVEPGAVVEDSVLGTGTVVKAKARVVKARVASGDTVSG